MAYVNVCVLRYLKVELAGIIDKWLRVISNKMLFKTVTPLKNKERGRFKLKTIL